MTKSKSEKPTNRMQLYTSITTQAANAIRQNAIKVTVLSAATVITFTGGVLVLPKSVSAETINTVVTSPEQLLSVREKVKEAVVSGLSEEEYLKIYEKFSNEGFYQKSKRMGMWKLNPLAAEHLGLSRIELVEQLRSGLTLREIAENQGVDFNELQEIFRDQLSERIKERKNNHGNPVRLEKLLSSLDSINQP
jgi:hypothetical protein